MADAVKVLRGLEELYPEVRLIERLRHCIEHFPNENWEDAMSRGQIRSKQWIIHELQMLGIKDIGWVAVCGGWLGTLSRLLLDCPDIEVRHITSLDLDLDANIAAGELNGDYIASSRFVATVANCYYCDYEKYDTVINTSFEHFEPEHLDQWWHALHDGQLIVVQSNNFWEPEEHVNCVHDEEELEHMLPMREVYYRGTLPTHKYNRFMVIGRK